MLSTWYTRNVVGLTLELQAQFTGEVTSVSNGPAGKSRNGIVNVYAGCGAAREDTWSVDFPARVPRGGREGNDEGPPQLLVEPAASWPGTVTCCPCPLSLEQLV